jgi:bifunctional DNA-binding transcriptional regulator/antitoxin component of YhaV-PrlF toxin-antitoxin module
MTTLTITSKGQVTLRREVLEHLGAVPGDRVTVELAPDGRVVIGARRGQGSIHDSEAILARYAPPQPLTIEQINEAIDAGWTGEDR